MPSERLIVVGGVAAGMSAASRARAVNPRLEIVVLEKGDTVSYGTCGLPFLVSGTVPEPEKLVVYTPEFFRTQRNIDVRVGHEAAEILPAKKQVQVQRQEETLGLDYDKLILTTGGAPRADIPGADLPCVFNVNSLPAAVSLRQFLVERRPRRAVVIGGGYIGLEASEALKARGLAVIVLERSDSLLEGLEPDIVQRVGEHLAGHGMEVHLACPVKNIDLAADGSAVILCESQQVVAADLVVLATGLVPRTDLAERAGIELGTTGAIHTDDRQQTNLAGVYAAGDCTETTHRVTGGAVYVPLGTTANKQGRVAGENAAGGHATFPGIVGTMITRICGLEVARTGLDWAAARAAGFQPEITVVDTRSQARYLGGKPLRVTLVVDRPSGRLLGAQLVGEEGAARRVDVVATALTAGMTVSEFVHLDLGYAPPFGGVYDPLLVAAWQAQKKIGRRR